MLTPPKADKCESLHYLKMNFSGQLEDRRETGALHHGRAAGLNDGSDIRATRGRTGPRGGWHPLRDFRPAPHNPSSFLTHQRA